MADTGPLRIVDLDEKTVPVGTDWIEIVDSEDTGDAKASDAQGSSKKVSLTNLAAQMPGPTGPQGPTGATGPQGPTGATGATGPAGPAPSGTGFVHVTAGVLDIPAETVHGNTITAGTGTLTLSTFTLTVAGTASISGTNTGDQTSVSGNAGSATALATPRTITITGDLAYTSPAFDGSANVTAAGTLATVNSNVGSFTNANITVNAKGLITAASNGSAGGGGFTEAAAQTASFTAAKSTMYPVDLTSATANFNVTFPSSPSAGDEFGFYVKAAHSTGGTNANFATRPFFGVEPLTATSIEGSSYTAQASTSGTAKWGLWIAGEMLVFHYTGSTWVPRTDGRIPQYCKMHNAVQQTISKATETVAGIASVDVDNFTIADTANHRMNMKRTGSFFIDARWGGAGAVFASGEDVQVRVGVNGTIVTLRGQAASPNGTCYIGLGTVEEVSATQDLDLRLYYDNTTATVLADNDSRYGSRLVASEVLQ